MDIELERTTRECFSTSCPTRFRVKETPGGAVFIGKDLDADTLAKVQDRIGPGEHAVWVPDELL